MYSLERFEDDLAVLCDDDRVVTAVDRTLLPETAKLGDVFYCENGRYYPDKEETAKRRSRIWQMEQLLRNKKR